MIKREIGIDYCGACDRYLGGPVDPENEIERLKLRIKQLEEGIANVLNSKPPYHRIWNILRNALEGK